MLQLKWKTVQRKVKDLLPLNYNPRKLSDQGRAKLIKSLEKFDLVEIPVINRENELIAGNQRVSLLMDLGRGEELIDVRIPNRTLTKQELKEYNITSNTHVGIWDVKKLDAIFDDVDIFELGISQKEIQAIRRSEDLNIKVQQDDFEQRRAENCQTKMGDLYELTNLETKHTHRLLCGDSTKLSDIQKATNQQPVDLIVSDPPYNVDYEGQKGMKIENDKMGNAAFYDFLFATFSNYFEILKKGGCIYISHADSESMNFRRAFINAGFMLKQCLIWVKNHAVLGRQDYNWKHEPILFGWKSGKAHYFIGDYTSTTVFEPKSNLSNKSRAELISIIQQMQEAYNESIIRIKRRNVNALHPTMKPVELWAKLIINSSRMGEIIFDGFVGSGTALIAAEQTKRICYGVELTPWYCDESVRRWLLYMTKNDLPYEVKVNGKVINAKQFLKV